MSESPLAPDNAASSAPATPQEPPKYGHIRGSQRGLQLLDTYRTVCRTAELPIREILKRIRIEASFGLLVKTPRKAPR